MLLAPRQRVPRRGRRPTAVTRYRACVVVFEKDAINIEFLVAFQRAKTHCACGIPVREATVPDERVPGRERDFIACANATKGANGKWKGVVKERRCRAHLSQRGVLRGDFYAAVRSSARRQELLSDAKCGIETGSRRPDEPPAAAPPRRLPIELASTTTTILSMIRISQEAHAVFGMVLVQSRLEHCAECAMCDHQLWGTGLTRGFPEAENR